MAKKKRKHFIKLNNKIKSLFNNKPFEEAILEFDDDTLYGLIMLLEGNLDSIERINIIKYLRRIWSEGNYNIRRVIVSFLEDKVNLVKNAKRDKVELILSFLEDTDATPQEEETILSDFMDKKASKITKQKVEKKLFYIRMKKILDEYSKLLNITFVGSSDIEFIDNHKIDINGKDIELSFIHNISFNSTQKELLSKDKEDVISILKELKKEAIKNKENSIKTFLNSIYNIEYLKVDTIYDIFKSIKEPIKDLDNSPIPLKIVKKILKKYLGNDINISLNSLNFLISKSYTIDLNEKDIKFIINISFSKKILYNFIWTNKIIDIVKEFEKEKDSQISYFEQYLKELIESLKDSIYPLNFSIDLLNEYAINFLLPYINNSQTLRLKDKIKKRAIFHFNERFKAQKEQKKREILLAKTIRDFKKLFPVARSLNREIIFHVGPTNSGKTYSAMQELKKAQSGYYLAPLRLLALEGYENLKKDGINVSLITGEEEIIDEESTHISSTIEMLNSDIEVDVCVIDEIQLINDRDRGWAWANALIGAPAKKIILTGSSDAIKVVQELAEYLEEPLTIIEHTRKNPLKFLPKPTQIDALEPLSAIVTFSRKEVLALKSKISPYYKVSVIYGNLSPEVRREEAKRFREGKSDILIATDAIAMGLNLPIKTILFARDNKFDGLQQRVLTTSEILQIAGRAGRFGIHENGYIGALDHPTLSTIKDKFNKKLPDIKLPISVMASLEHVTLISDILQIQNLYQILEFFYTNMEFDGPFVAANIDSMLELAKIVDEYDLDLVSKYHLACAPVSINSPYLERVFHRYLKLLEEGKEVEFLDIKNMDKKAISYTALLHAEDRVKEVSLYLWLSFKFSDKFKDIELARSVRKKLNSYIERSLREATFTKHCKRCGVELDLSYRFSICDKCYNNLRRGVRGKRERR